MHVSWGEICHFKHPAHFGSKSHDHQDFSREKTRTKPSFSRPNFNAYFNVDYNRDLEPEQKIKQWRLILSDEKHEKIIVAVRK